LGWLTFCALIAWFVGRVLDYAAQLFDQEISEFSDADARTAALASQIAEGLRPAHIATEQNERACTQVTQLRLPSTPPSRGR
jgi:hypothetical protein